MSLTPHLVLFDCFAASDKAGITLKQSKIDNLVLLGLATHLHVPYKIVDFTDHPVSPVAEIRFASQSLAK